MMNQQDSYDRAVRDTNNMLEEWAADGVILSEGVFASASIILTGMFYGAPTPRAASRMLGAILTKAHENHKKLDEEDK